MTLSPFVMRATLLGSLAPVFWGIAPALVMFVRDVPLFALSAITFGLAFLGIQIVWRIKRISPMASIRQPLGYWCTVLYGILGFHLCYFTGLKLIPPEELYFIENLWPFLLIIFTALIGRAVLHWWHIVATIMGFVGVVVLALGKESLTFHQDNLLGYGVAFACALIFSTYSLLNRQYEHIPPMPLGWVCGINALLCGIMHFIFESSFTVEIHQMVVLALLAAGPMGSAFFLWDYGTKKGDIPILSCLAYGGPFFAVAFLVMFGFTELTWNVVVAFILVVGGAMLGSWDMLYSVFLRFRKNPAYSVKSN